MHKKFEINRTKIKGGCQSESKVVPHDSKNDLPLSKLTPFLALSFIFSSSILLESFLAPRETQ